MKALKWVAIAVGVLVVIAGAVAAFLAATFDPNDYKPRIVELVKGETGRTLAIDGKISLTFFPKIGAVVRKATLSEPNLPGVFARVEEARVGVELWPLLSRQVIVDRVALKGLAVDLVRYKDGRTNFDDLTGKAAAPAKPGEAPRPRPPGAPLVVDVGRIEIERAAIGWRDERDGTNVRLSDLSLKTGRLASGVPGTLDLSAKVQGVEPEANLQVDVHTGYRIDFATQAVALSSLDAKVTGDARGWSGIEARAKGGAIDLDPAAQRMAITGLEVSAKTKDGLDATVTIPGVKLAPNRAESQAISADVKLSTPPGATSAKIRIAPLSFEGKGIQASKIEIDLVAKQPDLSVQGTVTTPVSLDLDKRQVVLSRIAGDLALSGKNVPPNARAIVSGSARADWGAEAATADLAVKLLDSNLNAKVGVDHWSNPAIAFNLAADRLDVDRYFPPSRPAPASAGGQSGGAQPAATPAPGAPGEQPIDLSALRTLNATGSVKIGALQASRVKAEQVALTIKAAGGKIDVNPITANLYEGSLAGSVAVNAHTNTFAVKQKLAGISVGPLLRDVASKDVLEGRGAVTLDVTTAGATVTALLKALAGNAQVALKDGTVKGIDIVGIITAAQALLGSSSRALEQQGKGDARTDFSELTASFAIKNGVAHNEDLLVKSPVVRLTGRGDIDIAAGTLDYTTSATLTPGVAGVAGKDVARLAGVPVPVRVTGRLDNPKYSVDVGGLATEAAKDTIQREIQRRLGGDKSKSTGDAVGDVLKGLFGKPKRQ